MHFVKNEKFVSEGTHVYFRHFVPVGDRGWVLHDIAVDNLYVYCKGWLILRCNKSIIIIYVNMFINSYDYLILIVT